MSCWCMGKYRGGNRGGTAASGGRERRPCRSRVVREARTASLHGSGAACCDRYESGVKKGGDREGRGFSGNVDLLGVVGKVRYAKRGSLWRRRKRTRYSVYPVQFLVALHGFVRSHVCCERALQCTATSANLRLAFAIERFLSRKSWRCRGHWQGHSDTDSIFALRLFSRVGGPHHQEGKGRGKVSAHGESGGRTY